MKTSSALVIGEARCEVHIRGIIVAVCLAAVLATLGLVRNIAPADLLGPFVTGGVSHGSTPIDTTQGTDLYPDQVDLVRAVRVDPYTDSARVQWAIIENQSTIRMQEGVTTHNILWGTSLQEAECQLNGNCETGYREGWQQTLGRVCTRPESRLETVEEDLISPLSPVMILEGDEWVEWVTMTTVIHHPSAECLAELQSR